MNRTNGFFRKLISYLLGSEGQTPETDQQPVFRITQLADKNKPKGNGLEAAPGFQIKHNQYRQSPSHPIISARKTFPKQVFTLQREPWEEFGWIKVHSGLYTGEYRVRNQQWQGKAEFPAKRNDGALFDLYCRKPPRELRNYLHRACWHHVGNGWYWIHFNTAPSDLGSGIRHIENALAEMTGGFSP